MFGWLRKRAAETAKRAEAEELFTAMGSAVQSLREFMERKGETEVFTSKVTHQNILLTKNAPYNVMLFPAGGAETKTENSRYADTTVAIKLGQPDYYLKSAYAGTRQLAQEFSANGKKFRKENIIERTDRLMSFALRHWPIW